MSSPSHERPAAAPAAAPADAGTLDDLVLRWRQEVAHLLLWMAAGLGALIALLDVPSLVAAGSWGILGFTAAQNAVNAGVAYARRLPYRFRATWLVVNLASAGLAALAPGGDRGVVAAFLLCAVLAAAILLGWRAAVAVSSIITVAFGVAAWGHSAGWLPDLELERLEQDTPAGWLGLWGVLTATAAMAIVAAESLFTRARALLRDQQRAVAELEQAVAALGEEQARRDAMAAEVARQQAARRDADLALRDTLEGIDAGFWEVDVPTGRSTWSDGMFRLMGYAPGAVTPSTELWRERTHPEDYARIMGAPPAPRSETEYRVVRPDGSERWVRSVMLTQLDAGGAPVRLRGIVTDSTAQRAAAAQLARLAEVASRTENLVVVTDLEGRLEWVNEAFTRITGWTLEELRGTRPGATLQGPHTDPATVEVMRAAIRARQPFDVEVLNYTRSGRQYWVKIEARLARDERGAPVGFVALETDITAARAAARRDSLPQRIAAHLLASDSVAQAGARVMAELVTELDIRAAQMWLVEPGNPRLAYVAGSAATSTGLAGAEFLARTRELDFAAGTELVKGVGVPGMAWGTRRTTVVDELMPRGDQYHRSRRQQAAAAVGLQTFCAVPILGPGGRVLGVLEIGGTAYYPGHELIPGLLERVAEQLAAFLRSDRSRRAFESVFQQSPDALLLADAGGGVRALNARAEVLFGPVRGAALAELFEGGAPEPGAALAQRTAVGAAGTFAAELSVATAPIDDAEGRIVAVRDLTERRRMEEALTRSLREKETLLREIHHRVKNNLQIVSSLLTLQADELRETPAHTALIETVYRVRSMSAVHQQLYGTVGLDRIELGEYARTLCGSLQASIAPTATLALEVEAVEVSIENAIPCGLILNELITNALKHGHADDGSCHITVRVQPRDAGFALSVADRGRGFPAGKPASTSLGMQLIRSLSRQLRGKVEFASDGGARVTMVVPGPL
jgi:PAS domain S-box-containing protein